MFWQHRIFYTHHYKDFLAPYQTKVTHHYINNLSLIFHSGLCHPLIVNVGFGECILHLQLNLNNFWDNLCKIWLSTLHAFQYCNASHYGIIIKATIQWRFYTRCIFLLHNFLPLVLCEEHFFAFMRVLDIIFHSP